MGFLIGNNPVMGIKQTVAQNLSRLMAKNPALDTLKKVDDRSGVGAETVRRAKKGEGNITLEKLDAIARIFGVSVAHMVTDHEEAIESQITKPGENFAVNQPPTSYDNKVAGAIKPKTSRQKRIDEISALFEQIDDTGLAVVLDKCRDVAQEYPVAIKQTPSS